MSSLKPLRDKRFKTSNLAIATLEIKSVQLQAYRAQAQS